MFLTNLRNNDPSKPSFFEMMAQTYFMPSLKPALHYIWTVLATRYPSKFYPFVKYSDEIFYGGLFLLNRRFLSIYDSTFSENFYGMERTRFSNGINFKLERKDKLKSLFFTCLVPYLKDKLDKFFVALSNDNPFDEDEQDQDGYEEDLDNSDDNSQNENNKTLKTKFLLLFKKYYGSFNFFYEFFFFLFQVMYLYNKTKFFDPFLFLQQVVVRRIDNDDMIQQETNKNLQRIKFLSSFKYSKLSSLLNFVFKIYYFFTDYLQYFLPLSIFFFKFLEWWYSEENTSNRKKGKNKK